MKEWALDLHIHSTLSPCGGSEMTPPLVLERARELGIDALAITDHNSAENVGAFLAKGEEMGIKVIPGMELQTCEDVHLLCLFDTLEQVLEFQAFVYDLLPPMKNRTESYGEQVLVDKDGRKSGEKNELLLAGADLSVEQAVLRVHSLNGLCIASHINRQAFSIWGHLGCIPPELGLDGVELTSHLLKETGQLQYLKKAGINYLISSDAHYLADLTFPRCFACIAGCTVAELRMALHGLNGRYIRTLIEV